VTATRLTTVAEMRAWSARQRAEGHRLALVPTMGALHDGHLDLVRLAARLADRVVVSIFVNPRQFDRADDLAGYPRDLDGDAAALAGLGEAAPDVLYVPDVGEVYPSEPAVTVTVSRLDERLCGASRPGHFDGVVTIVTKLCNVVSPDLAVFGRKDYQQLRIVTRLAADLDLGVEIVAGPTVREVDGVALSSRNRRLDADGRRAARAIPAALRAAVEVARDERAAGRVPTAGMLLDVAAGTLSEAPGLTVDYVEVLDPETLAPPDGPDGRREVADGPPERLLVAVAVHIGPVRLIDNVVAGDEDDEQRLLDASTG
jgi:pantoate--beta-alanine ligase